MIYGSYFGGPTSWEHVDGGTSRFDKRGIIYQSVCAGCGGNDDFPISEGAWPSSLYGTNTNQASNCNNGVFKIDFQLNSATASILTNTVAGCAPLTINFNNTSTPGHHYIWNFGNNDTTSVILNPVKTYTTPGTYTVALYVKTSICNNLYDTANITITVYPKPSVAFITSNDSCSNSVSFINQSNPLTNPFTWVLNAVPISTLQNISHSFVSAGIYTMQLNTQTSNGCKDSLKKVIIVPVDSITINPPKFKCINQPVGLIASGGLSYKWLPASSLSNSLIANPISIVTANTIYTVSITQNGLLGKTCTRTLTTQVSINPIDSAKFTLTNFPCTDSVKAFNTSVSTSSLQNIVWNFTSKPTSTINPIIQTYTTNGTYNASLLTINAFGCRDSITKLFTIYNFTNSITSNDTICRGFTSQLNALGGTSYTWTPSTFLSNPYIFNASCCI